MFKKSITFTILLWFVYGILEFDVKAPYSTSNIPSYLGFAAFICYFIFSLKQANKQQKKDDER